MEALVGALSPQGHYVVVLLVTSAVSCVLSPSGNRQGERREGGESRVQGSRRQVRLPRAAWTGQQQFGGMNGCASWAREAWLWVPYESCWCGQWLSG